jgi:hypothetical protein
MHENRILSNNEIANRPIIRILLNMQPLPNGHAHCPVWKLATTVCFLEDEDLFSVYYSQYLRNDPAISKTVQARQRGDIEGIATYFYSKEASSRRGRDLRAR